MGVGQYQIVSHFIAVLKVSVHLISRQHGTAEPVTFFAGAFIHDSNVHPIPGTFK
ncbi:MAG: hypothetical protein ACQCN6_01750 [Candidatus Bathyarchaeia archaeon]